MMKKNKRGTMKIKTQEDMRDRIAQKIMNRTMKIEDKECKLSLI